MAREVRHLLAGLRIVECDNARVTGRGEILARWAELDASDGFDETAEAVDEALGAVVEDVNATILVSGCGHLAVGGEVYTHAEAAFSLVLRYRFRLAVRDGARVVNVDATVMRAAGEVAAILA